VKRIGNLEADLEPDLEPDLFFSSSSSSPPPLSDDLDGLFFINYLNLSF